MNGIRLILTAFLFVAASLPAWAQSAGSDSHDSLPWGGTGELAKRLYGRLGKDEIPPAFMEPEMQKRLMERLKEHQNDPEGIRQALERDQDLKRAVQSLNPNDPQTSKRLEDMQKRLEAMQGRSGTGADRIPAPDYGTDSSQAQFQRLRELLEGLKDPSTATGPDMPVRGANAPNIENPLSRGPSPDVPQPKMPELPRESQTSIPIANPPTGRLPSLPQPPTGARENRGAGDFFQRLDKLIPQSLRESPSMNRLIGDVGKTDFSRLPKSRIWKEGQGPNINWRRVGDGVGRTAGFLDRNLPNVSGRNLPNAPQISAPNLPRGPSMPNIGGAPIGRAAGAESAVTVITVIGAVVLLAFLLWRFLVRPNQLTSVTTNDSLGPWPIDPSRIRTRQELVQAFNYLALRQFGRPAKVWHHRNVARHLGESGEERRRTANSLADAYAQARYAPPYDTFDDPILQRARHDLCILAEGAAS
jgi:hypothetical protein